MSPRGDIVTFADPGRRDQLVTHRLRRMRVEGRTAYMVTRGDSNDTVRRWSIPLTAASGGSRMKCRRWGTCAPWSAPLSLAWGARPGRAARHLRTGEYLAPAGRRAVTSTRSGRSDDAPRRSRRGAGTAQASRPARRRDPRDRAGRGSGRRRHVGGIHRQHGEQRRPDRGRRRGDLGQRQRLGAAALQRPGNTDTGCIKVSYAGSLASEVRLYGTTSGTGLDAYLDLTVTRGTYTPRNPASTRARTFRPTPRTIWALARGSSGSSRTS